MNRNVGKYRSLETYLFNNQFLLIIIPNNVKSRYNFERVQARALKRLVELLKEEKDHLMTGLNPMARRSVQGHTDYSIAA